MQLLSKNYFRRLSLLIEPCKLKTLLTNNRLRVLSVSLELHIQITNNF